jgi:hypothetical protein
MVTAGVGVVAARMLILVMIMVMVIMEMMLVMGGGGDGHHHGDDSGGGGGSVVTEGRTIAPAGTCGESDLGTPSLCLSYLSHLPLSFSPTISPDHNT